MGRVELHIRILEGIRVDIRTRAGIRGTLIRVEEADILEVIREGILGAIVGVVGMEEEEGMAEAVDLAEMKRDDWSTWIVL